MQCRRWTIIQLEKHKGQNEIIQCHLRDELAVYLRAAESYADNYTAWSHRAWLVERFIHDRKKVKLGINLIVSYDIIFKNFDLYTLSSPLKIFQSKKIMY